MTMASQFHDRADFEETLDAAADTLGLGAAIVEKDYWVSQALRCLATEFPQDFVFKGGTSLSKAFRIIERFSEDIDALIVPGERGRGACDTLMKAMGDRAAEAIQDPDPSRSGERGIHRTYFITYQRKRSVEWLRPTIDLEMGVRGGPNPSTTQDCTPLLADALQLGGVDTTPYQDLGPIRLSVLHPGRTAIEKLALVNDEADRCLRETTRRFPSGHGRHFYDIYMLLGDVRVQDFLRDRPQFFDVVQDCERVSHDHFGSDFVRPSGGYATGAAFQPDPAVEPQVRQAYENAEDLHLGAATYPTWNQVLDRVTESAELL
jgi:hypothetical protein